MTTVNNPFDILPDKLFNVFSTQGQGDWQRHYMAILLRIYDLAEFNRFGLTRQQVVADIVAYLKEQNLETFEDIDDTETVRINDVYDIASWLIRRLDEAGWVEREQQADYSELIILPDYTFTLLEAFRSIQEQKPKEYTGQLYAAHQLITYQGDDFSPALAIPQAYENIRQALRGLNELNQNIRRYTERVTRDRPVAELLRLQYDDYAQVLGPAYHALKTSDHVSRYRRDIVSQFQGWQLDEKWLTQTAEDLASQGRHTPAQAADEINHILSFIINQLEALDPLLDEIDRRHTQYLRTSLRQVRYQLVSADGSFKDRLAFLARQLAQLQGEGEKWLPEEMPAFQSTPIEQPDRNSFYTPPTRQTPFTPQPIVTPVLDPTFIRTLQASTLQDMGKVITPSKVQHFVNQFFNGSNILHLTDFPPDTFADEEDLPWLIYTIAYGNHPEVNYALESLPGDPVTFGVGQVKPFQLIKHSILKD